MLDQIHKLLARLSLLEKACEIRGSRQGILFLHATHLHTHMLRLDHDHHAQRSSDLVLANMGISP